MKKILALLLCIILICTLSVTVFASEVTEDVPLTEIDVTSDDIIDSIVAWVQEYGDRIIIIATFLASIYYTAQKTKAVIKSTGTLNNNAITVAENSTNAVKDASAAVGMYMGEIVDIKNTIKTSLEEIAKQYETVKLANTELANEVAELLVLANIPNAKKEELYARHRAAVDAIVTAGKNTEVIGNVEEA